MGAYALLVFTLLAQNKVAVPYTSTGTSWKEPAKMSERVTKDGHYMFTVDDPNNEWRCYLVSSMTAEPSAMQIVCARPHEVKKEQP
jgi:hypothetical protein